ASSAAATSARRPANVARVCMKALPVEWALRVASTFRNVYATALRNRSTDRRLDGWTNGVARAQQMQRPRPLLREARRPLARATPRCKNPIDRQAFHHDTWRKETPMSRRIVGAPLAFVGALSLACAGERSVAPPLTAPAFSVQSASDRKSTRLNSSHEWISYAVFCLKK